MVDGALAAQVHDCVLNDTVCEPEHPQQHHQQAHAREDEAGIALDGSEHHACSQQQGSQHGQGHLQQRMRSGIMDQES